ncbi:DUF4913 domain-containing protein [Nocardia sp. NPDC060249]|uniref:DUF4913 domain-containing protein n=1 Tax=Nocardia sp. NPDC060249 TaxID=3347082 RepID=UPI0036531B82
MINTDTIDWTGDDEVDPFTDEEEAAEEEAPAPPERKFATVIDWVEGYLVKIVRRKLNPLAGKGLSWDERWWMYPEVVARLLALHEAWEEARASDSGSAMSSWWIQHLEPHLRVILDGDTGPMSLAAKDSGFHGHPPMPISAVPDELRPYLVSPGKQ